MKIAFLHYNIGHRDGVNTVIRTNALTFLKKYKNSKILFVGSFVRPLIKEYKSRVTHVDIPEMDILKQGRKEYFSSMDVYDYMNHGMDLYNKLNKVLENVDYIIIENPNLGIHPAATYAYYKLVKRSHLNGLKRKFIYRIHDFPEDRRGDFVNLLKFTGTESCPYWHKVIFPKFPNLGFVVINEKDHVRLLSHGIIEEDKAFYVPNPINDYLYCSDIKVSMKLKELLIKKNKLDKDVKFLFYPVRIVPRKNVEEAIFLTQLLNIKFNEKYVLVVSLKEKGASNTHYFNTLNKFVKKHKLPVILGINDYVTMERTFTKSKKVKTYGIGDMYNISDKVISTSTLEGFGMFFIESWFFNKSIIGRDLADITSEFKNLGINLEHLYSTLLIDKTDFKDYGNLSKRLQLILKLKNAAFFEKLDKENKHALSNLYRMFDKSIEKHQIDENKKVVVKEYNTSKNIRKIMDAFRKIK